MPNQMKTQIQKFFDINGGYFGIIGFILTSLSVILASILYSSVNPAFNIISNAVSDLGTGPNMSNIIYNIGTIITGICQFPFYLSLVKYLQDKKANLYLAQIVKLTFMTSAIGLIVLGVIPFRRENAIFFLGHGSAAATHYVAGSFAFIFYGLFEILILKFSKMLGIISFLTGIIYGILWVGYLTNFVFRIPQVEVNYTLQWIGLAGILIWSLLHSIFLFKTKLHKRITHI